MSAEDVTIKNKEAVQNDTQVSFINPTNRGMLIPHQGNLEQDLVQNNLE